MSPGAGIWGSCGKSLWDLRAENQISSSLQEHQVLLTSKLSLQPSVCPFKNRIISTGYDDTGDRGRGLRLQTCPGYIMSWCLKKTEKQQMKQSKAPAVTNHDSTDGKTSTGSVTDRVPSTAGLWACYFVPILTFADVCVPKPSSQFLHWSFPLLCRRLIWSDRSCPHFCPVL